MSTLLLLLLANVALLFSYDVFYDERLRGLRESQKELEGKLERARAALEKVKKTDERLAGLQGELEEFYGETLGSRKERLAELIEEIYGITRKAGLRPQTISYAEVAVRGADEIDLSFHVDGTYASVKKLMHTFETSPRFLVVESVGVSLNEDQPDQLGVSISLAHFFRGETVRPGKKERTPQAQRNTRRPR
jgi:hypothetical protein